MSGFVAVAVGEHEIPVNGIKGAVKYKRVCFLVDFLPVCDAVDQHSYIPPARVGLVAFFHSNTDWQ